MSEENPDKCYYNIEGTFKIPSKKVREAVKEYIEHIKPGYVTKYDTDISLFAKNNNKGFEIRDNTFEKFKLSKDEKTVSFNGEISMWRWKDNSPDLWITVEVDGISKNISCEFETELTYTK